MTEQRGQLQALDRYETANHLAATIRPGALSTGMMFLDETGMLRSTRDPVFILGAIHSLEPAILTRQIGAIRDKHHWYDEMKWTEIVKSNRNLQGYREVLQAFFNSRLDEARFSCLVMAKSTLDLQHYFNNNVWEAYESFAVLEVFFAVQNDEILTVLADEMSVPPGVYFEENLCRRVNERKGRLAIAKALRVRSKGCDLLQLADVLVGAIAYDFKLKLGTLPTPPSPAKLDLLKLIKDASRAKDFTIGYRGTGTAGRKVRVRLFNARPSPDKKIAGHGPSGATPATPTRVATLATGVNVPPDALKEPANAIEALADSDDNEAGMTPDEANHPRLGASTQVT